MQHTLWIKLVAFTCGLVLICTTSCRSADSKVDRFQGLAKPTPPPGYQPAARQILTLLGESYSPQVSPGGERLVFIGKSRPTHEHGQVYEMSLSLKSEKRITFQDGTLESPSYFNDGKQILYASSTDEDKEYADVVLRNSSAEEPTTGFNQVAEKAVRPFSDLEIYSSYLDGSQIERLTISKKFDGAASVHPNGKFIVFSSLRSGSLQLYTLAFDSLKVRRLTQLPGNNYQAKYSRQGQHLAWVSVADDYKSSELQVSNARSIKPKSLLTKKAMHLNPAWSPDGQMLLFSSNMDDENNFEIYTVKIDGSCLQRLTYELGNDTEPVFSPDGSNLFFTSDRSGTRQIYQMPYTPPKTCPESQE